MLIMATCILTIYLLLPGISYQARDRIYRIFVTKDLSERIKLWVAAIEIIKARPILGVGVANYGDGRRRFAKEDPKLPAHSNYLQIGAEMGLLGLFAFLWIAIGGVLSSFWIFRGSPNEEIKLLGLGFLGLWIWFLVQSQFATYYDSTKFSMLFWLLAGLNMSLYRTNSRNS
jgi:putative inorganic carbon (HCO3(-)) transporter